MTEKIIRIAEDFSKHPSGRKIPDGKASGEKFWREHLLPALEQFDKVVVWLDGVNGYPSSFSEEAFGGLVRSGEIDKDVIQKKLEIEFEASAYRTYKTEMLAAIKNAEPNSDN